jgi:hypothetical protein
MMQDDCGPLSKWFASRLGAKHLVRLQNQPKPFIRQAHRYTYRGRSVMALEYGTGMVKVSEIDMERQYPYCPAETVDSAELVPEPMKYYKDSLP